MHLTTFRFTFNHLLTIQSYARQFNILTNNLTIALGVYSVFKKKRRLIVEWSLENMSLDKKGF